MLHANSPAAVMPILAAGSHFDPRDGACLMEAAAWLAGEPWTDHPRCVHPSLAAVARLVNDACSQAGRSHLAVVLPQIIRVHGTDARVAPALVLICAQAASRRGQPGVVLKIYAWQARRRLRLLDRGGAASAWCRASDVVYRGATAERAITQAMRQVVLQLAVYQGAERDRTLIDLLERCVDLSRTLLSAAEVDAVCADPSPLAAVG